MEASAQLERVTRRFGELTALEDLTLTVGVGEVVALVGPSGCGKSTLLELLAGLQRPDGGPVLAEPAAYMPQRDLLLPWRSALANAALALECAGWSKAKASAEARPLFERFGLGGFEDSRPDELSGGMRQRVALARTFLRGARCCCSTSRSRRSTRSRAARCRSGSRTRCARAAHGRSW